MVATDDSRVDLQFAIRRRLHDALVQRDPPAIVVRRGRLDIGPLVPLEAHDAMEAGRRREDRRRGHATTGEGERRGRTLEREPPSSIVARDRP
jgi:hypothetical protein